MAPPFRTDLDMSHLLSDADNAASAQSSQKRPFETEHDLEILNSVERPAKTHCRRDHSKAPFAAAEEVAKDFPRASELCHDCAQVDFLTYFQSTAGEQKRRSLNQAVRNEQCGFCQLVVRTVMLEDDYTVLSALLRSQEFTYKTVPYKLRPEDHLERAVAVDYTQWRVRVFPNYRKGSPERQDAIWTSKYAIDVRSPLELSNISRQPTSMIRESVADRFKVKDLKAWLDRCDEHHEHSRLQAERREPDEFATFLQQGYFRVIDVTTGDLSTCVDHVRYVALSYVWGENMIQAQERSSGNTATIDFESLAPTIREAIQLVRALGEKYIWIDAYCIDQHRASEKAAVIGAMSLIYASSYLTLVAASGTDAHSGLARMDHHICSLERAVSLVSQGSVMQLLPSRPSIEVLIAQSRWARRGWTYQEHMLSPRCLFVTESETFLRCAQGVAREAYTLIPPAERQTSGVRKAPRATKKTPKHVDAHDRLMQYKAPSLQHYHDAVIEFTARNLTYEGDRLDAFAGILQRWESCDRRSVLTKAPMMSGTLARYFIPTLAWVAKDPTSSHRIQNDARKSQALPSWSWVGWSGPVDFWRDPWFYFPVNYENRVSAIDSHNLVLLNGRDQNLCPLFRKWERKPLACPLRSPIVVTLHVFCATSKCSVRGPVSYDERSEGFSSAMFLLTNSNGETPAGDLIFGNEKAALAMQSTADAELAVIAMMDHGLFVIFLRRHEDYAERIECARWDLPKYSQVESVIDSLMTYEYVKLR